MINRTKSLISFTLILVLICGLVPITSAEADELTNPVADYEVGDIFEFGYYPQSQVTDEKLINELNNSNYTLNDFSYDSCCIFYCDVTYDNVEYRGIYFHEYRPADEDDEAEAEYSYVDDNGYYTDIIYWFEYEPLEWRVLDPDEGFVMCENIIDSQPYHDFIFYSTYGYHSYGEETAYDDTSCMVYANDYESSYIRLWLNYEFYNLAFNEDEQAQIGITDIDNSAYPGYEEYDSASRSDKIFLLSYDEVLNTEYGFSSNEASSFSRQAKGTDYAKIQGLYVDVNSSWFLRTPGTSSDTACYVSNNGSVGNDLFVDYSATGVRPAFKFNPNNDNDENQEKEKVTTSIADLKVGDTFEFGSYPQKLVTDSSIITVLNAMSKTWFSYDYYSGTSESGNIKYGSMVQRNYAKYCDITYDGVEYRGVYFTEYRPFSTTFTTDSIYSYVYSNGYSVNVYYWFEYEPLEWRVLDPKEGLVMCESVIDSQPYQNLIYSDDDHYYNDSSCTTIVTDYATSSIRNWLNDDFYYTAFSASERKQIEETFLQSAGIKDSVFLLSYSDVINPNYGFSSDNEAYDTARLAQGTDYAKAQGLSYYSVYDDSDVWSEYDNNCYWLLRTSVNSSSVCTVYINGAIFADLSSGTDDTIIGIRPAVTMDSSFVISSNDEESTTSISDDDLDSTDITIIMDDENDRITLDSQITAEAFISAVKSGDVKVLDCDGNELEKALFIGTGCTIQIYADDSDGIIEYAVVVPMDVDGNGKVTASDARLALRCAAKLDTLEGVYALAADADLDGAVKPSDARKILRKAAKLE